MTKEIVNGELPECEERIPEGYCNYDIVGQDKCVNILETIGCMEEM